MEARLDDNLARTSARLVDLLYLYLTLLSDDDGLHSDSCGGGVGERSCGGSERL